MKWAFNILFLGGLFLNCESPLPGNMERLTHLPGPMKENSGLEVIDGSPLIWMINDSGNKDHLYGLNIQGKIIADINIKNATNRDWEDLAADEEGNVYIADIGNNNFDRDKMYIYKVPEVSQEPKDGMRAEQIEFVYPGYRKDQPYNAEALVFYNNQLYIFSKNKRKEKELVTSIFAVPAEPGSYVARFVGSVALCDADDPCRVTAADISPDGKTLALLGHDKVWIGGNFLDKDSIAPFREIALGHRSQKEGLCFLDNETLYLSDERDHTRGGMLYRLRLNEGE